VRPHTPWEQRRAEQQRREQATECPPAAHPRQPAVPLGEIRRLGPPLFGGELLTRPAPRPTNATARTTAAATVPKISPPPSCSPAIVRQAAAHPGSPRPPSSSNARRIAGDEPQERPSSSSTGLNTIDTAMAARARPLPVTVRRSHRRRRGRSSSTAGVTSSVTATPPAPVCPDGSQPVRTMGPDGSAPVPPWQQRRRRGRGCRADPGGHLSLWRARESAVMPSWSARVSTACSSLAARVGSWSSRARAHQ
jgi:hypothetical protein